MKYDAVIFDLFGTLIDEPAHFQLLSEMAATLPAPEDDFMRLWSEVGDRRRIGVFSNTYAAVAHICRELGLEISGDRVGDAARLCFEYTREAMMSPRHDALETLSHLRDSGYGRGLISNCSADIPAVWPETSISPLVDAAVFSCIVGIKKPDPRIYQAACQQLGVSPERCVYVGDGDGSELTGASQAGMDAVQILMHYDDGIHSREEWHGAKISTLAEVLELIA